VIRIAAARFVPISAAVGGIRTYTVRTLRGWRVDDGAVDVAETIVSELAANAVRVSRPDEFVAVRLTAADRSILIEVWDALDTELPQIKDPNAESENGRGLVIIGALSTRWSWYMPPSGGKVVWARFPFRPEPLPAPMADDAPFPLRRPAAVWEPVAPVTYSDDPEVLRRVADALRSLDDWQHDTEPAAALVSG
jgi:hypothetical protein